MNIKVKCKNCGWTGMWDEVLRASNPFGKDEDIDGCPLCKNVNEIAIVCESQSCHELFSSLETFGGKVYAVCSKHSCGI